MVLLRQQIGDALRRRRQDQGRTLRQVSQDARVSLGYLSEVERGQKEASSELLASICDALELRVSDLLIDITVQVQREEHRGAALATTMTPVPGGGLPPKPAGPGPVKAVVAA
jgi:transcriptional regulator with XRE-family HTH domain